jgi:uncharacterized membrane protein
MTIVATRTRRAGSAADWLIPVGLLALAFIPVAAGAFRITTLVGGAAVTPANIRFFASPIPVMLHIVCVTIYSLLGAFQFSPGFRRHFPSWHRVAGRVLVVAGLVAALSGLWMAMFYTIVPADNLLLHSFRLIFGLAMAASIVLGFIAIRQRKFNDHQNWMRRAYAIGMGAGTQALIQIPYVTIIGQPESLPHSLLMGGAWAINLAVAEWLIRRQQTGRAS